MALGGGVFTTQNKVLPGSYINFVSAARASAALSERGVAAVPLLLDWGPTSTVFSVTNEEFQKDSLKIFGYDYGDDKLRPLRELFRHIRLGRFFRLNSGGQRATSVYATAKYPGTRGNDITIVIENSAGGPGLFDVSTVMAGRVVDEQNVDDAAALNANDYVEFIGGATLEPTAGTPLSGGTTVSVINADYQNFLYHIESYAFNVLCCPSDNDTIKAQFVAFTKRLRDEVGSKFQTVIHQAQDADYEGVVSVKNNDFPELVYWVTGALAGAAVNES
ncbi:MAG: phage tail sheath subtilisin-like domain-containing protein, partial [Oscillospiraceae bacterium]|nr:phage tail sheath subtilisin-like domain-containing protein [Oscillospiraceae bacterium]